MINNKDSCLGNRNEVDFAVDLLEDRCLLDGVVDVTLSNGVLKLTGDNENNGIWVGRDPSNSLVLQQWGPTQIRFNGNLGTSFVVPGNPIVNDMIVNFRGGDDVLYMGQFAGAPARIAIGRMLRINGGSGNDDVTLKKVDVGADVSINFGSAQGFQSAYLEDCTIQQNLKMVGGSTADTFWFAASASAPPAVVGGSIKMTGKGGGDSFEIRSARVGQNFPGSSININAGPGDDLVSTESLEIGGQGSGDLIVNTGSGNDDVVYSSLDVQRHFDIKLGTGDDTCLVRSIVNPYSYVYGNLRANLGNGNDTLQIKATDIDGDTRIIGGGGSDYVHQANSSADEAISISLGSGNDAMYIFSTSFHGACTVNGAGGFDALSQALVSGTIPEERSIESNTLPADFWLRFV